MAIRSARCLTGREIITGKAIGICEMEYIVLNKDEVTTHQLYNEHCLSGLAMYLIAIDCIGCLFDNKTTLSEEKNSIGRALKSFSSLDKVRIEAVKDLRNTLAHNFGLATENMLPKGNPKKYKHKFTYLFQTMQKQSKCQQQNGMGIITIKKKQLQQSLVWPHFVN